MLTSFIGNSAPRVEGEVKLSLDKAVEYLKKQQRSDGSWDNDIETTSFVVLGLISYGSTPTSGAFATEVAKGVIYLLSQQRPDGLYYNPGKESIAIVSHCWTILTFSMVQGMVGGLNKELKVALKDAVKVLERRQGINGKWSTHTNTSIQETWSIPFRPLIALRAAKDNAVFVSDSVLKKAIEDLRKNWDPQTGRYLSETTNWREKVEMRYGSSASGLGALFLSGEYEAKEIGRGLKYLEKENDEDYYFWWNQLYASFVYHQVGGDDWDRYYERLKLKLLKRQNLDGSWNISHLRIQLMNTNLQTALAVLVLSTPCEYLPIFQR